LHYKFNIADATYLIDNQYIINIIINILLSRTQVYSFNKYLKDWALVNKDGLYGFINSEGTEVVSLKYEWIEKFNKHKKGWAKVYKDG
jgi:hypothetical protein